MRLQMLEMLRSGVLLPSLAMHSTNDSIRLMQSNMLDADVLSLVCLLNFFKNNYYVDCQLFACCV